ncbi:MAG: MFS transporter, partial [Acidobacteria bacterium]
MEKRRLVDEGHAIDARHEIISEAPHFTRDLGVMGFVGIEERQVRQPPEGRDPGHGDPQTESGDSAVGEHRRQNDTQLAASMALTFVLLTVFIDMLGLGILIPIIPFVVREFSPSALTVGLLSMSFAGFQFVATPILGRLSDQHGRRPLLLLSLFGSAVGYVMFGMAQSLAMLFAARIIDGITGGNVSIAQACIADVTKPADRSKTFGLLGAAFGLGFILGPAIGGAVSHAWGLSAPAFLAAGLAFSNTLFGLFVLPETHPIEKRRKADVSARSLNPIGGIIRAMRHEHLGSVFLGIFAFNVAFSGLQSNFSLFSLVRFNWGPQEAALLFSLIGVVGAITQAMIVRKLVKKFRDRSLAATGLVLQTLSYLLTAFVPKAWMLYPVSVLTSFGVGITTPTLTGIVSSAVSETEQGVMLGTTQSVTALTRIVGPLWAGLSFDWLGPGAPYWSGAIMIAIAA